MTDQIVYKVKDAPGLVRDPYSKAIIATNTDSLLEQKKKRRAMIESLKRNKELEREVHSLTERINKMEEILLKLAEK